MKGGTISVIFRVETRANLRPQTLCTSRYRWRHWLVPPDVSKLTSDTV